MISSGFHTQSVAWRLLLDLDVVGADGRGGIGLDDVVWLRPVYAGDAIRAVVTVGERRLTRKGKGFVRLHFDVRNQRDQPVMTFSTSSLFARADGEQP